MFRKLLAIAAIAGISAITVPGTANAASRSWNRSCSFSGSNVRTPAPGSAAYTSVGSCGSVSTGANSGALVAGGSQYLGGYFSASGHAGCTVSYCNYESLNY
jgi:hypothetical protein